MSSDMNSNQAQDLFANMFIYTHWATITLLLPLFLFSLRLFLRLRSRGTLSILVGLSFAIVAKSIEIMAGVLADTVFQPEQVRQIPITFLAARVAFDTGLMITLVGFAAFSLSIDAGKGGAINQTEI